MGLGRLSQQTGYSGRVSNQLAAQRSSSRGKFSQQKERVSVIRKRMVTKRIAVERKKFFEGLTYGNYKTRYYKLSAVTRRGLQTPTQIEVKRRYR
jgi:hypothetical protein